MDSKVYHSDVNDPSFDQERMFQLFFIMSSTQKTDFTLSSNTTIAKWELVYSARQLYGSLVPDHPSTTSLNPPFWHRVTEAFERNQTAFELYQSLRLEGGSPMQCDATCKKDTICQLRALRSESACVSIKILLPSLLLLREELL